MRDYKALFKRIGTAVLSCLAFYLLARARITAFIAPLASGLYAGAIYCRKNYYILSLSYLIAYTLANMNYAGLIAAVSLVAVFGIAKLVHYKLAVVMRIPFVTVYCALAQVPSSVMDMVFNGRIVMGIASIAQAAIFAVLCCYCCYALLIRTDTVKFSYDEKAGIFALIAALSLGLAYIDLWGFMPYYIALGAVTLLSVICMRRLSSLGVCVAVGVGAAIRFGSLQAVGAIVLIWAGCVCFSGINKWLSSISQTGVFILCGYIFECFPLFSWKNIIMYAVGVLCVLPLSNRVIAKLRSYLAPDTDSALKFVMARERDGVFKKINGMAGVFIDMSVAFDAEITPDTSYESAICMDMENIVCASCPNKKTCVELCEGKNHIFMNMVKKGLEGKRVSEEDLPLFVISKCDRLVEIAQCCESEINKAGLRKDKLKDISDGSRVIAAQTRSIGKLLAGLAADVGRGGNYDMDLADKLIGELGYNNVSCRNAAVFGSGDTLSAALSVRRGDETKKALLPVVNKVLGQKMRVSETCDGGGGYTDVMVSACPVYDIIYGSSGAVKSGQSVAGDTVGIRRIMRDRILCILCDGMGSGKAANSESTLTMSALEGFYKSGFDDEAVLSLINRYLCARGGEKFCALDICLIDLKEGSAQFIKLGGVESYILRASGVECIRGNALPIGILDDIKPYVKTIKLSHGDTVVMVSDGITDALTAQGAEYVLRSISAVNPQRLCDNILASAVKNGAGDDATVIAVKLLNNRD